LLWLNIAPKLTALALAKSYFVDESRAPLGLVDPVFDIVGRTRKYSEPTRGPKQRSCIRVRSASLSRVLVTILNRLEASRCGCSLYLILQFTRKLTFRPGLLLTQPASLKIILVSPKRWSTSCPRSWSDSLLLLSGEKKRLSALALGTSGRRIESLSCVTSHM
jgi:hypothetical protein